MTTIPTRFNLWCIAPGAAHVVAFEHNRADLEALAELDPLPFPDDGIRFEILPDGAEPDLVHNIVAPRPWPDCSCCSSS